MAIFESIPDTGVDQKYLARDIFLQEKFQDYYALLDQLASKGDLKQKLNGIYYTPYRLARILVEDINISTDSLSKNFIDPCAGLGSFIFAYLDLLLERNEITDLARFEKVLNHVFYCDIDKDAADHFQEIFADYYKTFYNWQIKFPSKNVFIGDSLFQDYPDQAVGKSLTKHFKIEAFDYVFTNPPYLLIKKGQVSSSLADIHITRLSNLLTGNKHFKYLAGVNNLYKLFVEQIIEYWAKDDATIGLLVPRGLLTDSQSQHLRRRILNQSKIGKIYDLPENSDYFRSIGQAFSMFTLTKGSQSDNVEIYGCKYSELDLGAPITQTSLKTFANLSPSLALVPLQQDDLDFISHLAELPRFKSYGKIKNLRGELDLTLDKSFIIVNETNLQLIKGADIAHYELKQTSAFVLESFKSKAKGFWSQQDRIACQQISNQNQKRRLKWCHVPSGFILGNSCNFVGLVDSDDIFDNNEIDLMYLLAVLNSDFMNHRFKLLSANNHVSNHEISEMPLALPDIEIQRQIGVMATKLSEKYDDELFRKCELELRGIFGL